MGLGKRTFWSEMRVVWTVALRDLKIYSRYRVNFITGVLIPLPMIVHLFQPVFEAATFGPTEGLKEYIGTIDYVSFSVFGLIFWLFYEGTILAARHTMRDEMFTGTLELSFTLPVKRTSLLAGFCLEHIIFAALSIISMFIVAFTMIGVRLNTTFLNVSLAFIALLLTFSASFGLGSILAGLVIKYREPALYEYIIVQPILYYTGTYFTVAAIPEQVRFISYLLPTSYASDSIRGLLLGTKTILPIAHELLILAGFALLLPFAGLFIFKKLEKAAMKKEGIGAY